MNGQRGRSRDCTSDDAARVLQARNDCMRSVGPWHQHRCRRCATLAFRGATSDFSTAASCACIMHDMHANGACSTKSCLRGRSLGHKHLCSVAAAQRSADLAACAEAAKASIVQVHVGKRGLWILGACVAGLQRRLNAHLLAYGMRMRELTLFSSGTLTANSDGKHIHPDPPSALMMIPQPETSST